MGTRSLTVFFDEWQDQEIVVMYRQFDGYIGGHGHELAEYLAGKKVVNGLGMDTTLVFNGMACLAASVVSHFKTEPGGFYLYPAGTRDTGEEYRYEIRLVADDPIPEAFGQPSLGGVRSHLKISVFSGYPPNTEIFRGTPEALLAFEEPQGV